MATKSNVNDTMSGIFKCYTNTGEYCSMLNKYDSDLNWFLAKLKALMFVNFTDECKCVA
jgi:hypothetical protein